MDDDSLRMLWSILSILCSLAVLTALIILWRARHSKWLMAATVGYAIEFLMGIRDMLLPGLERVFPYFSLIWQLSAVLFAVGLLGYALETKRMPAR